MRLCIWGVGVGVGGYCGPERPDVERVMQRNNQVFVPTAPMSLLSFSIALLMPFQTLHCKRRLVGRGRGGQGYLCLQVGGCELAENTCS